MVAATSLSLLRNLVDALPKCEGCGAVAMLGRADHSALYCEACGAAKAGFDFCKWAGAAHRAQVAITAPTIPISDEELHVMRHAIGADRIDAKAKRCRKPQNRRATLEAGYRDPWRNHYCVDVAGLSGATWRRLVAIGLAKKRSDGSDLTGGDAVYLVNATGRERLLELAKARLLGGEK